MSQSPLNEETQNAPGAYLQAFGELAQKIREGQSFSGRERNVLFLNTGKGRRFADASYATGWDFPDDARGMAFTDWDGDGSIDVWLSNRNAPRLRLLLGAKRSRPWLAVRLQGDPSKGCPRDPAGARVAVDLLGKDGKATLWRTLALGDGFLSQSSQTLHFGLGDEGKITGVKVFWPGQKEPETFSNISANQRWLLAQGQGQGRAMPYLTTASLGAKELELPEATGIVRLRLSQPLSVPPSLTWTDGTGTAQRVETLWKQGPVLISLWSPDCEACNADLARLASSIPSGMSTAALCTDSASTHAPSATATLTKLGWKATAGFASSALVEKIDDLRREAVYKIPPMPLPTHVLIDKGGWLSAFYLGALPSDDQVKADLASLPKGSEAARASAVPFPSLWAGPAFGWSPIKISQAFQAINRPKDAQDALQRFLDDTPEAAADDKQKQQLAEVHYRMADLLRLEAKTLTQALQHFDHSQRLTPQMPAATLAAASALASHQRYDDALEKLTPLRSSPQTAPDALTTSGDIELQRKRPTEALRYYRQAVSEAPRYLPGLNNLAWLLATSSDASIRNGAEAQKIARFFLGAPQAMQTLSLVSTAAAAEAAAGDFPAAMKLADQAIALARQGNPASELRKHQARRALYEKGEALRE